MQLDKGLTAPIEKGQVIGKVSYEIEGKVYTANLVAESKVEKSYTGLMFCLIFICIIVFFGYLRVRALYKRNKVLNKIRGK